MKPLMADMEKMHQSGVVHRDIAPDNIIQLSDGRLKLINFGAARSYVGDKSMTVVVRKGFAPVEQYMRKGSNASADVYALAATIYYCITGIIPPDSAECQYGEAVLKAPSELGAGLSAHQEQALEKALEIQPKDRTQTVADLAQGLAQSSPSNPDTDAQKAVAALKNGRKKRLPLQNRPGKLPLLPRNRRGKLLPLLKSRRRKPKPPRLSKNIRKKQTQSRNPEIMAELPLPWSAPLPFWYLWHITLFSRPTCTDRHCL